MTQRVSSPVFVGREHELHRVSEALAQATDGQSAAFLVAGEAGVGKTRFLTEVARRARGEGVRVLEGGCVQVGSQGLPFGPFTEALRGLSYDLPANELEELLGAGRPELTRLMPQLLRPGEADPSAHDDPTGQSRLFEHLLALLGRLTTKAPLLLLIEDLHWADRSSMDLLGFLTRNVRSRRIVLIASYRSDELHRRHPLLPFLAEQERAGHAERMELRRFEWPELATQLRGILGREPDADLLERIMARSQGNAFYAEELLAGGRRDGLLPATLREVLQARLGNLNELAGVVVRAASAGRARVAPAVLAAVTGMDERNFERALGDAIAEHVLVPVESPAAERYAFRHALLREAAYDELLPGERTRLHAAFAEALAAEDGDAQSDGARAAELAYHWQAANDLPRAFEAWLAAGIGAERLYASAEAADNYDHALELWDKVPDADERAPIDRVEVLTRAGLAVGAGGTRAVRAVEYFRAAIDLVDRTADPVRAGLLYEHLGHHLGIATDQAGALAAYEEAVRLVPAEPPSAARAHVLAGLGTYFARYHRIADSAAICSEAVSVATAAGVQEAWALIPLGFDLAVLGDVERGLATLHEARASAAALGRVLEVARADGWLVLSLLEAGRFEDAVVAAARAEPWAASHGLGALWGVNNAMNGAQALVALGRWEEAWEAIGRGLRYGRIGPFASTAEECYVLLEALRGQFESAGGRLARRPAYPPSGHDDFVVHSAPAELALWSGDPLTAREALGAVMARRPGEKHVSVRFFGAASALALRAEADLAASARARHADEDLAEAHRLSAGILHEMRAVADEVRTQRPYYVPMATASLALCEAEFARLEARPDPDAWAAAAEAFDGQPYTRAYALTREGEAALAGPRDRARAAAVLDAAGAIATRLGARPLLRLIKTLATASGAPAHATAVGRPEARGRYDLSPREREVLGLLAAGRSDGEIAETLFISPKTASVHVANIKGKLGAQSRVEIVMRGMALGLVEAPSTGRT